MLDGGARFQQQEEEEEEEEELLSGLQGVAQPLHGLVQALSFRCTGLM